ncbi:hypothetical protein LZG04_30275 [Saccharothrix sp. S26]|uniref:hypothetical protein n=1 Tax=Saccharothrix sp. S26 TaxID=2907215 RepID=UPI001F463F3A|nr:hypothetical protein [Saccharothrix sp. S26]MCE6999058.1 hypothetical protein [Saccharothrix sp. S26]
MTGDPGVAVQSGSIRRLFVGGTHERHGVYALAGVLVVGIVVAGLVAWSGGRGADDPAPPVLLAAVAAAGPKADCKSGWVVPGPVDEQARASGRPAGGVLSSGGVVVVTVQGLTDAAVVLQEARIEVVRRDAPKPGVFLRSGCGSDQLTRYFDLDLDDPQPVLTPQRDSTTFPFRISESEPERFSITPVVGDRLVEWVLRLRWTSGAHEGELVVDDNGTPFATTGTGATAYTLCPDNTGGKLTRQC